MLNRLKMLSGMSGMQKSFSLEEAAKKEPVELTLGELEEASAPRSSKL